MLMLMLRLGKDMRRRTRPPDLPDLPDLSCLLEMRCDSGVRRYSFIIESMSIM